MTNVRTALSAGALALAVGLPAAGPVEAQEPSGDRSVEWVAERIEERAGLLADRVEERGERRAQTAADEGRRFLAETIEENAEQEADNIRRTGDYLATCVALDGDDDCAPHGIYWALIPEGYDRRLFGEEGPDVEWPDE